MHVFRRLARLSPFGFIVCLAACNPPPAQSGSDVPAGFAAQQSALGASIPGRASAWTGPTQCVATIGPATCQTRPFDTASDAAFVGHGARPATAKDCYADAPAIHAPAFVNDGQYGNGSSWLANSANSWVEVDLGAPTRIDGVRFGRDRTGALDDRDPGQFKVLTALTPGGALTVRFDSVQHGFSGQIDGNETIHAAFAPVVARVVRLQVSQMGAAIDELEVNPALIPVAHAAFVGAATCRPNYASPGCLAQPFDAGANLARTAAAQPAVARETLPGHAGIHASAHLNDGEYGNGSSWIAESAGAWIKIDLGQTARISALRIGRDRLGHFADRDPGSLRVLVAQTEASYADGDDTLDAAEYVPVFETDTYPDAQLINGADTVQVRFPPQVGRYIKLEVGNAGTALDEVEVYGTVVPDLAAIVPVVGLERGAPPVRWVEGNGGFWDAQTYLQGDFDGDGQADIARIWNNGDQAMVDVFVHADGGMTWRRWAGPNAGAFGPDQTYLAGDFDGDGLDDLVRIYGHNGASVMDVLRSDGAGFTAQRWATQAGGHWAEQRFVTGDFNGDGRADVAKVFGLDGQTCIDVFASDGAAFAFTRWITDAGTHDDAMRFAAGDFDDDGLADIARISAASGGAAQVDVFSAQPQTFAVARWMDAKGTLTGATRVVVGDFDGDGDSDLAAVEPDGQGVRVDAWLAGAGGFTPERLFDANTPANRVVAGDFDRDGRAEIASIFGRAHSTFIDMLGVPAPGGEIGQTGTRWARELGGFWVEQSYFAGDFDADGRVDVARVHEDTGMTSIDVHLNDGGSLPWARWITQSGSHWAAQRFVSGDFNGDGHADIAKVFSGDGVSTSIDVFLGGATGFTAVRWITNSGGHWATQKFVAGDFDGDGRDDIAKVFDLNGITSVDVYRGQVDHFAPFTHWIQNAGVFGAEQTYLAGDFNADGRADIARISGDASRTVIDVFAAQPDQTFTAARWATRSHPFSPFQKFVAGNFDDLGADDIVKVHDRGDGRTGLRLFAATGAQFIDHALMESPVLFTNALKAVAGDMDADGITEVVAIHGTLSNRTNMDVYGGQTDFDRDSIHMLGSDTRYSRPELAQFLAAENMTLVDGTLIDGKRRPPALIAGQCAVMYVNSGARGDATELGVLACAKAVVYGQADVYRLVIAPVLGGCGLDKSSVLGARAQCSWGSVGEELTVSVGDVQTTIRVKGPGARMCRSVTPAMGCMGAGAELWQTAFIMTDARGNGGGAGVHAGFGMTGNGGYSDGVVRFEGRLGVGIGVSFNVSVNVADAQSVGQEILFYGNVGFEFAEEGVSETIAGAGDAINAIGDVATDVVGAIGETASDAAGAVGGAASDAVDALGDFFGW